MSCLFFIGGTQGGTSLEDCRPDNRPGITAIILPGPGLSISAEREMDPTQSGGLDGHYHPPYYADMRSAVWAYVAYKFSESPTHHKRRWC